MKQATSASPATPSPFAGSDWFDPLEEAVRGDARSFIGQLLEEGDEPDAVFREIIATFLTAWLQRHVFGIDKQLEAFILQSYMK